MVHFLPVATFAQSKEDIKKQRVKGEGDAGSCGRCSHQLAESILTINPKKISRKKPKIHIESNID